MPAVPIYIYEVYVHVAASLLLWEPTVDPMSSVYCGHHLAISMLSCTES
jgi:hypothetical protein